LRELAGSVRDSLGRAIDPGPLAGIPLSVKDLFGFPGHPTYAGTPCRLPGEWESAGPLVAALMRQGALIGGKTVSGELALGGLGLNPHWGTPPNPWDPFEDRAPGGSSSGAAISILEGSAWAALGTDTGGSARVPASFCGLVGLKVSYGRWPMHGVVPLAAMFDSPGLVARTAADCGYLFQALDQSLRGSTEAVAEYDPPTLTRLRVGIGSPQLWCNCDAGVLETATRFASSLGKLGVQLRDVAFPEADIAAQHTREHSFVAAECEQFVRLELPEIRPHLSPSTRRILAEGAALRSEEVLARQRRFGHLLGRAATVFDEVDLVACPTVPLTSPSLTRLADYEAYRTVNSTALLNTVVVNLLGLCALTLPAGVDGRGLPVGLQLIAPAGAEARLLAAALAIERRLGTPSQRLGVPPRNRES
jgi:aspartyl-tRNA(Asn)/glutamyl-tRNA(Gln) amidotransferase subunit A